MIALYLRLSTSDSDLNDNYKDESNSIENQRLLLQNYIMNREDLAKEALVENSDADSGDSTAGSSDPAGNAVGSSDPAGNAVGSSDSVSNAVDSSNPTTHHSGILNVLEYIDDGYSGTNFDRPGFQKMIEDCRKGLVTTILVKDLSRFGRYYIGVGDYIDHLFPLLGVRFIAVSHNYDSNDHIGQPMGFDLEVNNLISSFYSRDLSKKQKATRAYKWKQGVATAAYAPYGYRKDPEHRGKFIIDPEAGSVVRLIFQLACDSWNTTMIAFYLNEQGVLTPGMYNKEKKLWPTTMRAKESEQLWTPTKVCRILSRYEYTGALVAGRYSPVKIGSRHLRNNEKKEWVITDDANPAIISKEEFETARSVIRRPKPTDYRVERHYLLKGKVKCGNCRRTLAYVDNCYEKKYYCEHGISAGRYSKCCKERFPAGRIEGMVRQSIHTICGKIIALNGGNDHNRNAHDHEDVEKKEEAGAYGNVDNKARSDESGNNDKRERTDGYEKADGFRRNGRQCKPDEYRKAKVGKKRPPNKGMATKVTDEDIPDLDRKIRLIREERMQKYERYASGRMSKEDYIHQKENLTEQIETLQKRKDRLEATQAQKKAKGIRFRQTNKLTQKPENCLSEVPLSAQMVEEFINTVYVYDKERIEIVMNYQDEIQRLVERMK